MLTNMRFFASIVLAAATTLPAAAQTPPSIDPLGPLDFLTGTWSAKTDTVAGTAAAAVSGAYTFRRDLAGHALERTSTADTCNGPRDFDCSHHDRLTLFSSFGTLRALYLDSEGHAIDYVVSMPDPHTAVLLSQGPSAAPRFRLTYHLEGSGPKAIMTGKFQMAPPGSDDFHSYMEWSGTKQ